jgi:biopolymer transport protein TolQ
MIHLSLLITRAAHGLPLAAGAGSFNLWETFNGAELFGKIIVVLLMFFSLLAWTVMINKYLDLSRWRRLNLDFEARLKDTQNLIGQGAPASLRHGGPYARLFHDAIEAARQHAADRDPAVRMGLVENALQRGVAAECVRYETKMVLLGSLVSGAPFMGLLGTVVGVMVAFNGMSAPGSTNTLQNIAPGVASALLATVAGLLVAIPSVFGYNFLLSQTKLMITEIENFASWLADRLELEMEAQKVVPFTPASAAPQAGPEAPPAAPKHHHSPAKQEPAPPPATERYLRFDVSDDQD